MLGMLGIVGRVTPALLDVVYAASAAWVQGVAAELLHGIPPGAAGGCDAEASAARRLAEGRRSSARSAEWQQWHELAPWPYPVHAFPCLYKSVFDLAVAETETERAVCLCPAGAGDAESASGSRPAESAEEVQQRQQQEEEEADAARAARAAVMERAEAQAAADAAARQEAAEAAAAELLAEEARDEAAKAKKVSPHFAGCSSLPLQACAAMPGWHCLAACSRVVQRGHSRHLRPCWRCLCAHLLRQEDKKREAKKKKKGRQQAAAAGSTATTAASEAAAAEPGEADIAAGELEAAAEKAEKPGGTVAATSSAAAAAAAAAGGPGELVAEEGEEPLASKPAEQAATAGRYAALEAADQEQPGSHAAEAVPAGRGAGRRKGWPGRSRSGLAGDAADSDAAAATGRSSAGSAGQPASAAAEGGTLSMPAAAAAGRADEPFAGEWEPVPPEWLAPFPSTPQWKQPSSRASRGRKAAAAPAEAGRSGRWEAAGRDDAPTPAQLPRSGQQEGTPAARGAKVSSRAIEGGSRAAVPMASADELLPAGSSSRLTPADAATGGMEGSASISGSSVPPEAAGRARKKGGGRRQQPHVLHQQDWQYQEPLLPLQQAQQHRQQQRQRGQQRQQPNQLQQHLQHLQGEQPFLQQQAQQQGPHPRIDDHRQQHQQQHQQQQWTAMPPLPVGPRPASSLSRAGSSQLEETWGPTTPGLQASSASDSGSWLAAPPAAAAAAAGGAGAGGFAPGGTVEDEDFNSMLLSEC